MCLVGFNTAFRAEDLLQLRKKDLNGYVHIYDTRTGRVVKEELLPADNRPAFPGTIDVNPANGDVYICADPAGDYGYADYSAPGFVYRYTADGTFVKRYAAGVHPCAVIFR